MAINRADNPYMNRYPGEPENWLVLNPLATDPEPNGHIPPIELSGSIDPLTKFDSQTLARLERRRVSRVKKVDGIVIVGGKSGGKTWKEELVRRGVRPDRANLPEDLKLKNPGFKPDKEPTVPSKLREREHWTIVAKKRAIRTAVVNS